MLQVKQASPFPQLAERWSAMDVVDAETLELTRSALSGAQPADLAELRPLLERLAAHLEGPGRDRARRALFTLLDRVRRRTFTALLAPADVDPWVRLLLPLVARSDYTLGEVLRSREETDPRTVALRVLGPEPCEVTVADLARRTRAVARGVLALVDGAPDA